MLAYRSTPLETGFSPAQLLMNRRLKTTLPVQASRLEPQLQPEASTTKRNIQQRTKQNYDRHTKPLPALKAGDRVRIQDHATGLWSLGATVRQQVAPRSYQLDADNGSTLRRNRQHIRLFNGPPSQRPDTLLYDDLMTQAASGTLTSSSAAATPPAAAAPAGLSTAPTPVAANVHPSNTNIMSSGGGGSVGLRRSTRVRQVPSRLIENM